MSQQTPPLHRKRQQTAIQQPMIAARSAIAPYQDLDTDCGSAGRLAIPASPLDHAGPRMRHDAVHKRDGDADEHLRVGSATRHDKEFLRDVFHWQFAPQSSAQRLEKSTRGSITM